jgi:hypothetical protein
MGMQQWRKYQGQGIDNPNPRQQILDNLTTFVKPYLQAGNEIFIMMDAANDRSDSTQMDKFINELDLWDLMANYKWTNS